MKFLAMLLGLAFVPAAHADVAVTDSSQTFTAANTFASAVTLSTASTLSVAGFSNLPVFLSSQAFTAVRSSTFSLAAATGSAIVDCDIAIVQVTTNGALRMSLNSDGWVGDYAYTAARSEGSAVAGLSNNGVNYIDFSPSVLLGIGYPQYTHFSYALNPAATWLPVLYNTSLNTSGGVMASFNGAGLWRGGNSVAYATIYTTAGTITGSVHCYYKQF